MCPVIWANKLSLGSCLLCRYTLTPPVSNLLIRSFSSGPSQTPGIPPPSDCRRRRSLSSYCGLTDRESVCVREREVCIG